MPIGPGSRRKRPRNDLDDYLDEVESKLFCVTRADKSCLLRDIKAHVRELTTDEKSIERFGGKYQISMDQLREEIGEPDDIVAMYISSVKKKVPSLGLRLVFFFMATVFLTNILIGIDRYGIGITLENENSFWLKVSGIGLSIVAAATLSTVVVAYWKFDRIYRAIAYIILLAGLMAFPLSIYLARELTHTMEVSTGIMLQNWYGLIILTDIIIIALIGLYIYLRHFQVMTRKENVVF